MNSFPVGVYIRTKHGFYSRSATVIDYKRRGIFDRWRDREITLVQAVQEIDDGELWPESGVVGQ